MSPAAILSVFTESKYCLIVTETEGIRHNVTPFIIEDNKKNYYYRGLSESFVRILDMLDIY